MGESLDKEEEEEEEEEEYGTDRSLETMDVPTKEELKAAVDKLKNNKAPGPDGIPGEILKEGYKYTEKRIYELIVQIWNEKKDSRVEAFHWLILHIRYCQSCYMED